jgi:hypothetical protein
MTNDESGVDALRLSSLVLRRRAEKRISKVLDLKGIYISSVTIFSNLGTQVGDDANMPLPSIDNLRLRLAQIDDL